MKKAIRIGRFGLCEGFVELFRLVPRPRDMGSYIAMFRKRWQREGVVFMTGLKEGGTTRFLSSFKKTSAERNANLTGLLDVIASRLNRKKTKIVKRNQRYVLS